MPLVARTTGAPTALLPRFRLSGVMATATQQRSREIGIGMATRAGGRMIRGKVLRDGVRVVGPVIRIETAVSAWLAGRSR